MPLRMLSFSASSARTLSVAIAWNEEIGLIIYAQCSGAHCLEFCWMLLKKMSLMHGRDAMVPAIFLNGENVTIKKWWKMFLREVVSVRADLWMTNSLSWCFLAD
jgi:hypothetical protein